MRFEFYAEVRMTKSIGGNDDPPKPSRRKGKTAKKAHWLEIVQILTPLLWVTERKQIRFRMPDEPYLKEGYYLALWPFGAEVSSYGPTLRFFGPFTTYAHARLLKISALTLGIVELESSTACG